jgi:hypothetical protein
MPALWLMTALGHSLRGRASSKSGHVRPSPESGSKFQALALPRTAEIEKWWLIVKAANIKAE